MNNNSRHIDDFWIITPETVFFILALAYPHVFFSLVGIAIVFWGLIKVFSFTGYLYTIIVTPIIKAISPYVISSIKVIYWLLIPVLLPLKFIYKYWDRISNAIFYIATLLFISIVSFAYFGLIKI